MAVAELEPILDKKLRKTIDFETFGRNIASAAMIEARKQAATQRNSNGANPSANTGANPSGNGDAHASSQLNVQISTKLHVQADANSKTVTVTVETPAGSYSVNV